MCYKTAADVDDGFGDRTRACRERTHPRANSNSRIFAAIPERTVIGPVRQVHIVKFLGTHGIEIQIPSTTTKERNSWVVLYRGKNRFVDALPHRDPGHNPTSKEFLLERSIAKESEPCATESEQSLIEETHAKQSKILRIQCTIRKKLHLLEKGKWNDVLACKAFGGDSLEAEISKLVMRLVRQRKFSDGLASTHLTWKQQNDFPVLHEFSKFLIVYSCHSTTHWWEFDNA